MVLDVEEAGGQAGLLDGGSQGAAKGWVGGGGVG